MKTVYVISKECPAENGNAGWDVYQVYEDENHCHEACLGFAERYPEFDWAYTPCDLIESMVAKP